MSIDTSRLLLHVKYSAFVTDATLARCIARRFFCNVILKRVILGFRQLLSFLWIPFNSIIIESTI